VNFYCDRVLRVDLTAGSTRTECLNPDWVSLYLGGKGLLFRYLIEEIQPGLDPWAPENPLIVATGPFAGTIVPTANRCVVGCKSPATGAILDSYMGGSFGATMKFAGYDLIIVTGTAQEPVVLEIRDQDVRIVPAADLWGMRTAAVEEALRRRIGEPASVLSIGPAGEARIPFACISNDVYHKAARGGHGALMGAKGLKAIAVRGTGCVSVNDVRKFTAHVRELNSQYLYVEDLAWAYEEGTPCLTDAMQWAGALPTRNFTASQFEAAESISSESFVKARTRKRSCYQCGIACRNFHVINGVGGEGPEYETIAMCGPNCGIGDLEALLTFNSECDELGLDTISTGVVTALAMELTTTGAADLGLHFGDVDAYLAVPQAITERRGLGAELALGARDLARRHARPELAMHVKNMELPGYDPRACAGMALAYATSDRGGCHRRSYTVMDEILVGSSEPGSLDGKAALNIALQNYSSVRNTGVFCDFAYAQGEHIATLYSYVFQREIAVAELLTIGERIWNLARLFNIREGLSARDDSLPPRLVGGGLPDGPLSGNVIGAEQFQAALLEYYALRGWGNEGVPSKETLARLDIQDIAV
jgi:aldehyde:ferredoxin oxidoreductase